MASGWTFTALAVAPLNFTQSCFSLLSCRFYRCFPPCLLPSLGPYCVCKYQYPHPAARFLTFPPSEFSCWDRRTFQALLSSPAALQMASHNVVVVELSRCVLHLQNPLKTRKRLVRQLANPFGVNHGVIFFFFKIFFC